MEQSPAVAPRLQLAITHGSQPPRVIDITLPVEFDASARAKRLLPEMGLVTGAQGAGVASVLNAAAMTYVAGAVAAIGQLLYFLWVSSRE